jgi:formylglycine-generating enzyme required for sulfatase activity
VAEWCLDHYLPDYHAKTPTNRPAVKPTDRKWSHTVRGGSFKDAPEKLRSAARVGSAIDWMKHDPQSPRSIWWLTKKDEIGFRVCLPVEEQPDLIGLKPQVLKLVEHDPVTEDK